MNRVSNTVVKSLLKPFGITNRELGMSVIQIAVGLVIGMISVMAMGSIISHSIKMFSKLSLDSELTQIRAMVQNLNCSYTLATGNVDVTDPAPRCKSSFMRNAPQYGQPFPRMRPFQATDSGLRQPVSGPLQPNGRVRVGRFEMIVTCTTEPYDSLVVSVAAVAPNGKYILDPLADPKLRKPYLPFESPKSIIAGGNPPLCFDADPMKLQATLLAEQQYALNGGTSPLFDANGKPIPGVNPGAGYGGSGPGGDASTDANYEAPAADPTPVVSTVVYGPDAAPNALDASCTNVETKGKYNIIIATDHLNSSVDVTQTAGPGLHRTSSMRESLKRFVDKMDTFVKTRSTRSANFLLINKSKVFRGDAAVSVGAISDWRTLSQTTTDEHLDDINTGIDQMTYTSSDIPDPYAGTVSPFYTSWDFTPMMTIFSFATLFTGYSNGGSTIGADGYYVPDRNYLIRLTSAFCDSTILDTVIDCPNEWGSTTAFQYNGGGAAFGSFGSYVAFGKPLIGLNQFATLIVPLIKPTFNATVNQADFWAPWVMPSSDKSVNANFARDYKNGNLSVLDDALADHLTNAHEVNKGAIFTGIDENGTSVWDGTYKTQLDTAFDAIYDRITQCVE